MIFASDNWPGAHRAIAQALVDGAALHARPYGESEVDAEVEARLSDLFERKVSALFVATGTAANSLALASTAGTAPVFFCHAEAHVIHHEGGAVELMSNGGKLVAVPGDLSKPGKIDPARLERAIARFPATDVHVGEKAALTLSQTTEAGTVYTVDEIRELAGIAHRAGMKVHMDGARFSNAVAALGVTPAEMTWKAGIDILSLGGTKNGCWCAEAVVFFNPDDAARLPRLRKRGANLFSKSSFVAHQFNRWLDGGLWLELAKHSNGMAKMLADAVRTSSSARLAWQTDASQLFIIMADEKAEQLRAAGARFYDWETPEGMEHLVREGEQIRRFITSYATRQEDIEAIAGLL